MGYTLRRVALCYGCPKLLSGPASPSPPSASPSLRSFALFLSPSAASSLTLSDLSYRNVSYGIFVELKEI